MMYRPGTQERVWGRYDVDLLIVNTEEEERAAFSDGWTHRPDDEPIMAEIKETVRRGRPPKSMLEQEA